ncbi:thioesterase family protein [Dietzia psychralcaliphila]|uniref:thioesterase family protein n=1 Tax=Dietzia psychralcaliphila TaxID=139021 RepID=UPI001C1E4939|nr:thioesterase family protein [Dietzia psychralcaliphila]
MPGAFYQQVAEGRFEASPLSAGPWSPDSQHAGPPSALLVRAMERLDGAPGVRLSRVSVDVLGPIPVAALDIEVRTVRPGRSVELLEATASVDGRPALVARGWRMRSTPDDFPVHGEHSGPAVPDTPRERGPMMSFAHGDGYLSVVDFSFDSGGGDSLGPAAAWGRSRLDLVEGEAMTGWQHTVLVADSASGISLATDPLTHPAINCDLVVSLHREPDVGWVHLDSETVGGPGHGVITDTLLSDDRGRIGRSVQNLYGRSVV